MWSITHTKRYIYYWNSNSNKGVSYSNLSSNDEESIIKWLYQHEIGFKSISGTELHDIGDMDYFQGCMYTDDINEILDFVRKIYGEWHIDATYKGIDIEIRKSYPNIDNGVSFVFLKEFDEMISPIFDEFEKTFCYPETKEWTIVR